MQCDRMELEEVTTHGAYRSKDEAKELTDPIAVCCLAIMYNNYNNVTVSKIMIQ